MDVLNLIILLCAGTVGGAVNAAAGGGTFFTFPALVATGLDPLTANATSAVALYPGHAAAVPAYRQELKRSRKDLVQRSLVASVGALVGAGLLLWTGNRLFAELVPWLLMGATLIFALGPTIRKLAERTRITSPITTNAIEFVISIYGGYFGAGLGVILMAALTISGVTNIHMANAQKNLLSTVITTVPFLTFIIAGIVAWPHALAVMAGAIFGGYFGGRAARSIPAYLLRTIVVAVGASLAIYYLLR